MLALPLEPLKGSERAVEILKRAASRTFDAQINVIGVPFYTDARLYMQAGIPTVIYGSGPKSLLDANAHRANERLALEDLKKATVVIGIALSELLAI